jgi:lysophospholipase L1-like esterase
MKIAILADSLALPRQEEGGDTPYEATYPYLLEKKLRQLDSETIVIERGMRRRTIEDVINDWVEIVELRKPEAVIVHVGIVDCAPRVFLRRERSFVERLRPAPVRTTILNFAHNYRREIVTYRKKVYVSPERFAAGVKKVIELARSCNVQSLQFVNIIAPPATIEERSPGFLHNVEMYNRILESNASEPWIRLVDLNRRVAENGGTEALTVDGIHLTAQGHQILADELARVFQA